MRNAACKRVSRTTAVDARTSTGGGGGGGGDSGGGDGGGGGGGGGDCGVEG